MGYRILYFYKKENTFYREKRGVNLSFDEKELGDAGEPFLKAFFCGIPEYYGVRSGWIRMKAKRQCVPWTPGQLLRLMQNCCETVSADAYYLEEHFERELADGGFGFSRGGQRMCGGLIKKLSGQLQGIDSILYVRGEAEEETGELPIPEDLLRKLHHFFYLGARSKQYAVMEDNLWSGYGMPVLTLKKAGELAACRIRRLLVIDDRPDGGADWAALPKGCVYLDLWSDAGRRTQIEKNRADIKYISEYLYLHRHF